MKCFRSSVFLVIVFLIVFLLTIPIKGYAEWWDKFGEPKYGGKLSFRFNTGGLLWDTNTINGAEAQNLYMESLFFGSWTMDREDAFSSYPPDSYYTGLLAESWESIDPITTVIHLRKGIHWQDKAPVNGREFTAYDVQEHYDRLLGTGKYTEPLPYFIFYTNKWESVTATDKYTLVVKLKNPSAMVFRQFKWFACRIECPELLEQGLIKDWHYAVGTGPWILSDYVDNSQITFTKNPNYWGYDERHPENKLPYADELKWLIIPDNATAIAAFRTGKIDVIGGDYNLTIGYNMAKALIDSNPELIWRKITMRNDGLFLRVDKKPFTDIRVRKAMQMAINRDLIAQEFYRGDVTSIPGGLMLPDTAGFTLDYNDWPQELKDEYSYNPQKARELLVKAAADGVFEPNKDGGFDTNVIKSNNFSNDIVLIFKENLENIGIHMDINEVDWGTFINSVQSGKHDQIALWKIMNGLRTGWDFKTGVIMNHCRTSDSVYDQLLDDCTNAATESELMPAAVALEKYFLEQHWVILPTPAVVYTGWQPYLKGYSGEELRYAIGQIWARCWIDQD